MAHFDTLPTWLEENGIGTEPEQVEKKFLFFTYLTDPDDKIWYEVNDEPNFSEGKIEIFMDKKKAKIHLILHGEKNDSYDLYTVQIKHDIKESELETQSSVQWPYRSVDELKEMILEKKRQFQEDDINWNDYRSPIGDAVIRDMVIPDIVKAAAGLSGSSSSSSDS